MSRYSGPSGTAPFGGGIEYDVSGWGHTVTGSTINACLADIPSGSVVQIPPGTWTLDEPVAHSGKQVHLQGIGSVELVQGFTAVAPMIHLHDAGGSTVEGISLTGTDDAVLYDANYAALAGEFQLRAAIRLSDSPGSTVRDVHIESKITGVELDTCSDSKVESVHVSGFGPDILAGPNPANRHNGVSVVQGDRVRIVDLTTVDVGNAISIGRYRPDNASTAIPTDFHVARPHITNSCDNAIYLSSVLRATVDHPTVRGCNSSGVRIQGDSVTVVGGHLYDCGTGVAIQGRETTATIDGKWAGRGATVKGIEIEEARGIGVAFDDRSNSQFFTKDNTLEGVTVIGGCPTGAFYGTADFSTLVGVKAIRTTGVGIRFNGVGSSPIATDLVVDGFLCETIGVAAFIMENVTKLTMVNGRISGSSYSFNNFAQLTNVSDSDFANIRASFGRLNEVAGCTNNLIANVWGSIANVTNGSPHRAWSVAA